MGSESSSGFSEDNMPKSVPALLRSHGLRPRKRLGQNFLIDRSALRSIVRAADLSEDDFVVEVGAGVGTLTRALAAQAGRVAAIELDDDLAAILQEELAQLTNVQVIHGDVRRLSELGLVHRGYKVVANLPYYITSTVLRHYLEMEPRPSLMVVTVQREVAERIVARPGGMSLLSVSVQFYGHPRIVARVPSGAFYPPPRVESAVLRIDVGGEPAVALAAGVEEATFFRVVRAGFSQRRKTLRNSLSAGLVLAPVLVEEALEHAGLDPRRRAQTLSLEEWARASEVLVGAME
jgi:16S rRNA (adenine1518-N6/adenine1519-N6)-dimethyltransferase